MCDPFVPFLVLVVLPILGLAWYADLASKSQLLRIATPAFVGALVFLKLPYGGLDPEGLRGLQLLLSAAVIVVLALRGLGLTRLREQRPYRIALGIVAIGAFLIHVNFFGFHGGLGFMHSHDVAHYYLGSKYFPELGYGRLYEAMLRAENEDYGGVSSREARDLASNRIVQTRTLLEASEETRSRFTDERWKRFRADVRYFRREMGGLAKIVQDHGFNPTPVWALLGGALANLVPAGSEKGIFLLTLIDPILLIGAVFAVSAVFGIEAALLCVIYNSVVFGGGFPWIGGAYVRHLWLVALIAAACCLRAGRHGAAGAAIALAASLRVFPAFFALGFLARPAFRLLRGEWPEGKNLRFAAGFAITLALMIAASALLLGVESWTGFRANTSAHMQSLSSNLIGLRNWILFLSGADLVTETGVEQALDRRSLIGTIQLGGLMIGALLLVAWLGRRADGVDAMAMGVIVIFAGLNLTAYYYVMLIVLILAHYEDPWKTALIFGGDFLVYCLGLFERHEVVLYLYRSLILSYVLLALYLDRIVAELRSMPMFQRPMSREAP